MPNSLSDMNLVYFPEYCMDITSQTISVGGHDVYLETGRLAERATTAVTARVGDTMVLATVVMGRLNEALGYFPLQVEYQEKLYAGGKIKGSRWVKRDGRPSDDAVLKARLIDRSIRPLFPDGFAHEVQVIVTILSADGVHDADMPAMLAVSAALTASPIPWEGPISAVRVGIDAESEEMLLNPTYEAREQSILDLVLSGTEHATLMVEAGALEIPEEQMLAAFSLAEQENVRIAGEIADFAARFAQTKIDFEPKTVSDEVLVLTEKHAGNDIPEYVRAEAMLEKVDLDSVAEALAEKHEDYAKQDFFNALRKLVKKEARRKTLQEGVRADGRGLTDIRPLSSEVGLLPRTHGSALFKRGSTQALTIATLGAPALGQLIENMEGEYTKRYIHHYSMAPFTVGETGRVGYPSRREIGHGALAERALEPMIPDEEVFPYTIHVASELMSSNGSTSMASVCGSTMSLMDAGVPLKKPVAGIAMGLMTEGDDYVVLSDIMGFEDHIGDMDFKVAGTQDGITAMQMDIKVSGIPMEVLTKALEQARLGRLFILEHMLSTIPQSRGNLSQYAPKIEVIVAPVDRLGEIIGPSGKVVKKIIADTGAEIDIQDDGKVFISSSDQGAIDAASAAINGILKVVEPGEEYDGVVTRLMDFGAFVEILPGKEGLVHVSQMSTDYVKEPSAVVSEGDAVHVWVHEIDDMGRINLTMLSEDERTQAREQQRNRRPSPSRNQGRSRDRFESRPRRNRR